MLPFFFLKTKTNQMKKLINIPNGTQYLSQVMETLPQNCIFDKGKVGCGGTTIAITSPENYIICVPFVSLIKNKCAQHENVLGVYEKTRVKDIKDYLANNEIKKIMVTYDSLEKIMSYINPDEFNLLIDELHILFLHYSFRRNAVQKVLPNFTLFKSYCFMTATPVEDDFMLDELKSLPVVEAIWTDVKEVTVNSIKCDNDVKGTIIQAIKDFLSGKNIGNAYFFVNSVEFIKEMVEHCGLTNENTRVIYSDNNKTQFGIDRGYTTDPPKKLNFLTSTAFEGGDIYDEDGKVIIISDNRKLHTLTDISTSFQQIAGRIRNTKYWNSINHVFTTTRYYNDLSYGEFKNACEIQVSKVDNKIRQLMGLEDDLRREVSMPMESYVVKESDVFSFDPNLVKIDLYNFKITKCLYKLRVNVTNALRAENFTVKEYTSKIDSPIINMSKVEKSFKQVVKELEINFFDEELRQAVFAKYPFLEQAIKTLGFKKLEEMDYVITNIKRLLINNIDTSKSVKVAKLLKVTNELENGAFITSKRAKEMLQKIYDDLGISRTPNIKDFYEVKDTQKKSKGEVTRGYIIIIPKIDIPNF